MPCGSLVASLQMLLLMEGVIEHHFTPVAEQKRLFVWCCSFLPMVWAVGPACGPGRPSLLGWGAGNSVCKPAWPQATSYVTLQWGSN